MKKKSTNVPNNIKFRYDEITKLTDELCDQLLDDEYKMLCRYATASLGRKKPPPIMAGKISVWACGVVYALASTNGIFYKGNDQLHVTPDKIGNFFGIRGKSCASHGKKVKEILKMDNFSPDWCPERSLAKHPLAWYIEIDGFMVDARETSRELQEAAYERGLIPYIYADTVR